MKYKIAQLVVNPEEAESISQIFISQPGLEEESLLGRIFVMVEARKRKADISRLINFITNQIEHNYYQNEKVLLIEKLASVKAEDIFESAIARLNQNIITFLQTEKIRFVPGDISLTVGVLHKNKLHFANIGRNKALLIYQPKVQADNHDPEYDLTDITKKTNDPTQGVFNINKLFNNVISGSIPAGGCFIFANEALSEYLSEQQLIKVLTALHPSGAVEQIKNILAKTNIAVPFLALVIKSTKLSQFEPQQKTAPVKLKRDREYELLPNREKVIPKNDQTQTINTLNYTEEQTADILNPIGIINLKRFKKLLHISNVRRIRPSAALLKYNIIGRRDSKINKENIGKFLTITKKLGIILFNFLFIFFRALLRKESWHKAKHTAINVGGNFKQMHRKHKIILIVIIACALILITNLIVSNIVKENKAEQAAYTKMVADIQSKQKQIDADLIYGNRNNARITLNLIQDMLANFPQDKKDQQNTFVALNNVYQEQLDKISNITRIEAPEEIKTFVSESNLQSIALSDNALYITDDSTKTIYALNIKDKTTTTKSYSGMENVVNLGQAYAENGNIYYFTKQQLVVYNPASNKLEHQEIIDQPTNGSAFGVYNNHFYIFNKDDNQIYRYNRSNNTLNAKLAWLKFDNTFADVKSLGIDGYVYVLDKDTILKYGGGRRQSFDLDIIEPALVNPTQLIATIKTDLLYALEPEQNRIVVFDKDGKFLTQYTSDVFSNLISITIDEDNNKVYVLNGQTIYQIDLYQDK
jgi:phosphopantetheine adenylyltransferase